jgi:hypothetical protein
VNKGTQCDKDEISLAGCKQFYNINTEMNDKFKIGNTVASYNTSIRAVQA